MHRPSNDDKDTFIGLDVPTGGASLDHAQLSFGAPDSISNYIGNRGDGRNWKERLTASEKTLAVALVVERGNTLRLGGGSALSQMTIYTTPNIGANRVPPQSCLDVTTAVKDLTVADKITALTPPRPLGDLSLNAYPSATDALTLHFCNPSALPVASPAGAYSFLAIH
jgi:hypothetical protein